MCVMSPHMYTLCCWLNTTEWRGSSSLTSCPCTALNSEHSLLLLLDARKLQSDVAHTHIARMPNCPDIARYLFRVVVGGCGVCGGVGSDTGDGFSGDAGSGVTSSHHSNQVSQGSQVSKVILSVQILKWQRSTNKLQVQRCWGS